MRVPFSPERLRHWMTVRVIHDSELAVMIGRSEITVRSYRAGRIRPPISVVRELAKALDVAPVELLDLDAEATA